MVELIFFAAIAIWLISKLLASLGATDHEDLFYKRSSGHKNIKDVTDTGTKRQESNPKSYVHFGQIEQYLSPGYEATLLVDIQTLSARMPLFDCAHFMSGAKQVFTILTRDQEKLDNAQLVQLLDRGFIEKFAYLAGKYKNMSTEQLATARAYLNEIYFFGNKAYIKVEFILSEQDREYWTFTKNLNNTEPGWHLSNIQRSFN